MATKIWIGTTSSFTLASNWSGGVAPANSDTLVFDGTYSVVSCTTNLGSTLTGLTIIVYESYTGSIGVLSGTAQTYLTLNGGTAYIGQSTGYGSGSGSPLVMLDFGTTNAGTINVTKTAATSGSTYYPPVLVKGGSSGVCTLAGNITGSGTMGVAALPAEVAFGVFQTTNGGSLILGTGVTAEAITAEGGGTVLSHSTLVTTTLTNSGATYFYDGTGAHTTINNYSGTLTYNGTGTITTLNNWGTADFSGDPRAKTITNSSQYSGATLNVDNGIPGRIVFTNAIQYPDGIGKVTLLSPRGVKGTLLNI